MIVDSHRFGVLQVPEEKLISFERPILGFEHHTKFCLVEVNELRPFVWLQSTEEPHVAFLVVNPSVFFPDYRIEVNSKEIAELQATDAKVIETYVIVTLPDDPRLVSVNLQGPILINAQNRRAKQLVLVNSQYEVRHFLMAEQQTMSRDSRRETELVEL